MLTYPSMKLATSKPVAPLTEQPAGWPAQFDVMLLLKLKTPVIVSAIEDLAGAKREAATALDRVLALDPGHVVEDLEVVLVRDERLIAVGAQVPDVLERHLRHRRGGLIEIDAWEAHGRGRVCAVVDRELEELDRGPAEAELVQEARPQGVRVVEGQALGLDVSLASAEREPGIPMREAGRLDPMRLLVAVPREEAVLARQVVVDLDVELVVLAVFDRVEQVVVDGLSVAGLARAGRVGLRIELVRMLRATRSMRSLGMTLP